jgi:hypothetical protein
LRQQFVADLLDRVVFVTAEDVALYAALVTAGHRDAPNAGGFGIGIGDDRSKQDVGCALARPIEETRHHPVGYVFMYPDEMYSDESTDQMAILVP